ncbi:hypothetical protein BLNAU_22416 [Blattamonas nauphoetae]|uniref:Uncharacterized protein n=1 Tax=Blattamonas nauphoetae TaxID=2049346 RepID=A0ABQ9WXA5_9EUKA|nr:hypothetical protein BLNAU_22416 [Blattamonas nauphoetae]
MPAQNSSRCKLIIDTDISVEKGDDPCDFTTIHSSPTGIDDHQTLCRFLLSPEDTTTTKLSVANSRALRDSAVCLDNKRSVRSTSSATFTVSCIHWADLVSDDIVICSEHCCSNAGNIAQRENYRSASKNGWRMFQSIPTTKISSVRPLSSLICPCKAQTATMAQTNIVSPFVRIQRNCVVLTLSGRVLPHDHILNPENPPDLMDSHR